MKKIVALILALILTVGLAVPASAADQAKATTMRLVQTSGTVTVQDSSGVNQTVIKDMRLYSGYTVTTGSGSYAYMAWTTPRPSSWTRTPPSASRSRSSSWRCS